MSDELGTSAIQRPAMAQIVKAAELLSRFDHRQTKRVATSVATAVAGYSFYQDWRARRAEDDDGYQVTIDQDDSLYYDVCEWVMENLPPKEQRRVSAHSVRRPNEISDDWLESSSPTPSSAKSRAEIVLSYDESQIAYIDIDGHRTKVVVAQTETSDGENKQTYVQRRESITFHSKTAEGREAVVRRLQELLDRTNRRSPRLLMARYSHWSERSDMPVRPLDTVILRRGQKEFLLEDLDRFFASEAAYSRLGLPWHRGYLFSGPPGTGKSSLARGLASYYNMDVFYLSLSDEKSDNDLLSLISNVPARSVLLLEDVDVASTTVRDSEKEGKATLAGLLNALDGMVTPHGLVTIMTTNHIQKLDGALLRPGRADQIVDIKPLDGEQLSRLLGLITGGEPVELVDPDTELDLTAADVLEAAKQHLHSADWDQVVRSIEALIREEQAERRLARV